MKPLSSNYCLRNEIAQPSFSAWVDIILTFLSLPNGLANPTGVAFDVAHHSICKNEEQPFSHKEATPRIFSSSGKRTA